jgi:hypothetical protein
MQYGLNSRDLQLFGVTVLTNSDTFLAFPDAKESLNNDFLDQNGLYIDLSHRKFKARTFTVKCSLVAANWTDFFNKYDALFSELAKPGVHDFFVGKYGKTYKLYYVKQDNIAKPGILSGDRVGVTFDLVMSETNPFDNISPAYLVDEHDAYIIG